MFVSPKKFSNRLNVEVIIITSETTAGLYHIFDFKSWLASFIERTLVQKKQTILVWFIHEYHSIVDTGGSFRNVTVSAYASLSVNRLDSSGHICICFRVNPFCL